MKNTMTTTEKNEMRALESKFRKQTISSKEIERLDALELKCAPVQPVVVRTVFDLPMAKHMWEADMRDFAK